jgi:hypothetical protein
MENGPDIGHGHVVRDVVFAGFDVDFDSANPATNENVWPSCGYVSRATPISPWPASAGR